MLRYSDASAVVAFAAATLALAGLAWVVALATEQVGLRFGPAVTGFLQSTLGNLPEFFIVLFALGSGELVVAQTSLIGSIFANALLVLGLVIVAGTIRAPDGCMRFRPRLPQDTATLLFVSIFVIVIVGSSVASSDKASHHVQGISTVGAICLLVVYAAWLWRYLALGPIPQEGGGEETKQRISMAFAVVLLAIAGTGAAFVSDWFIHALDPAVAVARDLEGLRGPGHRGDRRQRGRELHRDLPRRQGQVRPGDLGGEELRRPDRGLPLPGAGPDLVSCSAPISPSSWRRSISAPSS